MRKLGQQGDHITGDQFKAGLAEIRIEIAEVRTEVAALDTRLSTQIADLRTEQRTGIAGVRTEIAEVRTEISALETRLIRLDGRDRARDGGADVLESCGSSPGRLRVGLRRNPIEGVDRDRHRNRHDRFGWDSTNPGG